ncbi:telomere resolvase [Acaryochloris sp. CCMEE 5410]|uniref:telomere resolvase n=1 Tax=Acaryochloris sp. CCMEE 5410 TaxID=310037 RepID=UPI0021D26460|nr:telomere resolvase [Acaryochloris sp. CCMEE 5410]
MENPWVGNLESAKESDGRGPTSSKGRACRESRHFEHMRFTTDEWTEINLQAGSQPREGSIHLITNPDAIVAKASQLLKSCQWANIIAGLTVITGRRCAELLKTATFSYQSPFSLWFTGTPKLHPTKPHPAFELPTLYLLNRSWTQLHRSEIC